MARHKIECRSRPGDSEDKPGKTITPGCFEAAVEAQIDPDDTGNHNICQQPGPTGQEKGEQAAQQDARFGHGVVQDLGDQVIHDEGCRSRKDHRDAQEHPDDRVERQRDGSIPPGYNGIFKNSEWGIGSRFQESPGFID
jgi:hypothetical protein